MHPIWRWSHYISARYYIYLSLKYVFWMLWYARTPHIAGISLSCCCHGAAGQVHPADRRASTECLRVPTITRHVTIMHDWDLPTYTMRAYSSLDRDKYLCTCSTTVYQNLSIIDRLGLDERKRSYCMTLRWLCWPVRYLYYRRASEM